MSLLHEFSEKVDSVATLSVATLLAPPFPKVDDLDTRINRFIVKTGKIIFF